MDDHATRRERVAQAIYAYSHTGPAPHAYYEMADRVLDGLGYPLPEDFAATWASKCEELARETATVGALRAVIRSLVEAPKGWQKEAAWAAAQTVLLIDEARQDPDFMGRLDAVRRSIHQGHSGATVREG